MSAMHFCDHCGKILNITKNGSLATARCDFCGKAKLLLSGVITKSKTEIKPEVSKEVASDKNLVSQDAVMPHDCIKCGHKEAYVKDLGTSYSDESNVYLFKCVKCGYTDRQADGCSNS